ncbi:MAG TPA: S9 family peptidase [Acidimicrobiia bacterium]|nr:S9 family peptidase [Acidimicrobiia bacterium]
MTDPANAAPPLAPARPTTLEHGDDARVDPWYWMRERDDPEVLAYLEAENAYTDRAVAHLAPLRERIYGEIVARVQETDASAPTRRGANEYFVRTIAGQQYDVHCRRPAGTPGLPDPFSAPGAAPGEEIVLDENALAVGEEYLAVGDLAISPSQEVAAYTVDSTGGERYELRFRDLARGADLPDVVPDVYYGLAFANDNRTVLFSRPDETMRPWQVWRHEIGTPVSADVLVFQEDDDRFFVSVARARTGALLVISSASKVTSEERLVDADDPTAAPTIVAPRTQGHEYHVEHHRGAVGDRLYVLSNRDGAENFALFVTPLDTPGPEHWVAVVEHRDDVRLEDVDAFADHIVVSKRSNAQEQLRVLELGADGSVTADHVIEPPDEIGSMWLGANPEWESTTLRYGYTSLVTPGSAFDYDVATRTSVLVKQQPVEGYDAAQYETHRMWATADDGIRVPISIVWRRDLQRPDGNPLLLYGYGSYEVSIDPTFSMSRVSLLDRGVVFAIAHVRGGGELGRQWYEQGKFFAKRNTFTDFVACARHLVDEGLTSPGRLIARGGSAGGLLMGAVANLAPELFGAIVAEVPFVDCLTTILDETLPLTVTEWEEWGDPVHDPALYDYMKSYSPYDNVEAKAYPAMLVTGGLNDPRVQFWEPAKWVAKLRSTKTDDHILVLKTEMGAGHSGPSGRYESWREEAFVLAFVLEQVGISE